MARSQLESPPVNEARCVSDCTGNLFTKECLHFTFMMFLSAVLVLFAMSMLIFKNGVSSLQSGYYFGLIGSVLTFWATPPKLTKASVAELSPSSSSSASSSSSSSPV